MSMWIYGIALAAVLAFGGIVIHDYNSAIEDKTQALNTLKTSQANNKIVSDALAAQKQEAQNAVAREVQLNQLLQDKTDEIAKAQADAAAFQDSYAKLKKQKPAVQAWAASPIPDDVRVLLRAGALGAAAGSSNQDGKSLSPVVDDAAHASH